MRSRPRSRRRNRGRDASTATFRCSSLATRPGFSLVAKSGARHALRASQAPEPRLRDELDYPPAGAELFGHGVDDGPVELGARAPREPFERVAGSERAPVHALRGHRVERVGDADESRSDRDLLTAYPVRV